MLKPQNTPGMQLRLARIARCMYLSDLATVGLNASSASRIENGKQRPTLDQAIAIEREFGIPASAWASRRTRKAA